MDYKKLAEQLKTDTLARIVADLTDKDGWTPGGWNESNLIEEIVYQGHSRIGIAQFEAMVKGHQAAH